MRHFALQGLPCLWVTRKAQRPLLLVEEPLELRGMRRMAGHASPLADDRRMRHGHRHALVVVTGHTELAALREGKLRELRGVRHVAGAAQAVLEGRVVHLAAGPEVRRIMAVGAEL